MLSAVREMNSEIPDEQIIAVGMGFAKTRHQGES
jgi:hypothetical protein